MQIVGKALLGIAVLGYVIGSARAEMPAYDPEAFCGGVARLGGGMSQTMLEACEQQEQAAYDHLKPTWDTLPGQLRSFCNRVASLGNGGSFEMLEACVDQELHAADANKKFQFQR